jgi:uncharacterized protein (TIGR03067 family)
MKRFAFSVAFAALLVGAMQAKVEEKKPTDKNAPITLLGDYTIVAGENNGKKEPDERIVGTLVHITEDRILVEYRDHKSTPYIATYQLETSKKPWAITMTSLSAPSKGEVAMGLIEKDGDQVRLIYALPGGDMPTEFKTKGNQQMFVMKTVSK